MTFGVKKVLFIEKFMISSYICGALKNTPKWCLELTKECKIFHQNKESTCYQKVLPSVNTCIFLFTFILSSFISQKYLPYVNIFSTLHGFVGDFYKMLPDRNFHLFSFVCGLE